MASPYDLLPEVPGFEVARTDVKDGQRLAPPQVSGIFGAGGDDCFPQLSWSGFPREAKGFVVHTVDVESLPGHTLARATMVCWYER